MTSPVRIEGQAYGDVRFAFLAQILGLADGHHALIKVSLIWSWQIEKYTDDAPTYCVPEFIIIGALGLNGCAALVNTGLAEETPDGMRMRGSKGRIEWRWRLRAGAKKGGEKRTKTAERGPAGRFATVGSDTYDFVGSDTVNGTGLDPGLDPGLEEAPAESSLPSPSPSPSPTTQTQIPDRDPERESGRARGGAPTGECDSEPGPDAERRALVAGSLARLNALRRAIAAELGLTEVASVPLTRHDERNLRDRLEEAGENAASTLDHVLRNLAAEARASGSVQFVTCAAFGGPCWTRLVGMTPADAVADAQAKRKRNGSAGPRAVHDSWDRQMRRLAELEALEAAEVRKNGKQS